MRSLLSADLYRMFRTAWLWVCAGAVALLSLVLVIMQYTAMDYEVLLDRVIFLPMAFYGLIASALVSMFVGDDFSGGVVKNKLIAGHTRSAVYVSSLIASLAGCLVLYLASLLVTLPFGIPLFHSGVSAATIVRYVLLGLLTCLSYGSIFTALSMLIGRKSLSVAVCMALAFVMLFLCLHTYQVLAQAPVADGAANPVYVTGFKRIVYLLLHDINPSGQASQLSSMQCLDPLRFILTDVAWCCLAVFLGAGLFAKRDIN